MKPKIYFYWMILVFILISIVITLNPGLVHAGDGLPAKAYVKGVKGYPQKYNLSCESRSAVDWAAFFGMQISEKKFLKNLTRSDNPDLGFVGNPDGPLGNIPPSSYGVHAEPVAALLREFGLNAQAHRDIEFTVLKSEISSGRPVIVWVIGRMWRGTPVKYKPSEGKPTIVAAYEHTMILVGYTATKVIAIDPATGGEQTFSLQNFLASWKVLNNMAVTSGEGANNETGEKEETPMPTVETAPPVITPPAEPTPTALEQVEQQKSKIYTVRRGDYLTAIARKFGVNWRTLARINRLSPPYILYTGQKLRIP